MESLNPGTLTKRGVLDELRQLPLTSRKGKADWWRLPSLQVSSYLKLQAVAQAA